uniref:Uncharacterized protein n=1 Tax=Anguilla anguilla TaxID=7936 RepID=A0A0E9W673_ANGAN
MFIDYICVFEIGPKNIYLNKKRMLLVVALTFFFP